MGTPIQIEKVTTNVIAKKLGCKPDTLRKFQGGGICIFRLLGHTSTSNLSSPYQINLCPRIRRQINATCNDGQYEKETEMATPIQIEKVNTNVFAKMMGCQPDTARKSLCLNGHYLGIIPVKLPNGRLMWPLEPALKIVSGEG